MVKPPDWPFHGGDTDMAKHHRVLRKSVKTKAIFALPLALSIAFVGVGQAHAAVTATVNTPTAAQLASWKGKTLNYLYFTDGPDEAATRALATKFEAATGAKVNIELIPFANLNQTLAARLAGGNAPDIARVASPATFVKDLLNLDPYLGRNYRKEFLPGSYTQVVNSTKNLVGIPYDLTINGPLVNLDLFKKAGVAVPANWSWSQMLAAAKKVQKATGTDYAFALDKSGHRISTVLSQFGSYMIDDRGHNALRIAPHRAAQALKTITDLLKADQSPRDLWMGTGTKYASPLDIFYAQDVPVYLSGNWQVAALDKNATFNWAAVPNPCQLSCGGFPGGKFLVAFKGSKNPDLAAYFLSWLGQSAQMNQIDQAANWLPTRADLAAKGVDYPRRASDMNVFLADSVLTPAKAYGYGSNGAAFTNAANALVVETQNIVAGKMTPAAAVADLTTKIDGFLAASK